MRTVVVVAYRLSQRFTDERSSRHANAHRPWPERLEPTRPRSKPSVLPDLPAHGTPATGSKNAPLSQFVGKSDVCWRQLVLINGAYTEAGTKPGRGVDGGRRSGPGPPKEVLLLTGDNCR